MASESDFVSKTACAEMLSVPVSRIDKVIKDHDLQPSRVILKQKLYDLNNIRRLLSVSKSRNREVAAKIADQMRWGAFTSESQIGWVYRLYITSCDHLSYIGMSAKNLWMRYEQHRKDLEKGAHHNGRLQFMYDQSNAPNKLRMSKLEEVHYERGVPVLHTLLARELHYIKTLKSHLPEHGFNITVDHDDHTKLSEATRG